MSEAIKKAKECRGMTIFPQIAELFRGEEPHVCCEYCGVELAPVWFETLLQWDTPECKPCKVAEEIRAKEKANDEYISWIRANMKDCLHRCGVPKRFFDAEIAHFPSKIESSMASHDGNGWFITGPRGTGKTYLAVAVIREHLLKTKYEAEDSRLARGRYFRLEGSGFAIFEPEYPIFVPITELLLEIRDTFNRQSSQNRDSEKDIIDRYSSTPLLVLDDLGAEKSTEWSMQTLYTLIDRRYRDEMRTIITSNMSLDELAVKVDDRIASRIAGMCKIQVLKGKDRRIG